MLEVPDQRRRADDFNGRGDELVFGQQVAELRGQVGCEMTEIAVKRQKAIGEAKVADAADAFLRRVEGRDEKTHIHGLEQRRGGIAAGGGGWDSGGERGSGGQCDELSAMHNFYPADCPIAHAGLANSSAYKNGNKSCASRLIDSLTEVPSRTTEIEGVFTLTTLTSSRNRPSIGTVAREKGRSQGALRDTSWCYFNPHQPGAGRTD
jgi:hypothetical protein